MLREAFSVSASMTASLLRRPAAPRHRRRAFRLLGGAHADFLIHALYYKKVTVLHNRPKARRPTYDDVDIDTRPRGVANPPCVRIRPRRTSAGPDCRTARRGRDAIKPKRAAARTRRPGAHRRATQPGFCPRAPARRVGERCDRLRDTIGSR